MKIENKASIIASQKQRAINGEAEDQLDPARQLNTINTDSSLLSCQSSVVREAAKHPIFVNLKDRSLKSVSYATILQQILVNDRRISMMQNSEIEENAAYLGVLAKVEGLNLQQNLIRQLPASFSRVFKGLKELNIQQNRVISIKDDVVERLIDPETGRNDALETLWVNLSREEEVEQIIRRLKWLKNLNGLVVDRKELEMDDTIHSHPENSAHASQPEHASNSIPKKESP